MNILITSYNRPETFRIVLKEVDKIEYDNLFLSLDAPKENDGTNKLKNAEIKLLMQEYARDNDKVHLILYSKNQGCRKAVSQSITECFTKVDDLIILEDDCLPLPGFFSYCEKALNEFRENDKVGSISSQSFLFGKYQPSGDIFLSKYHHCWGWATWKRSWNIYDDDVASFSKLITGEELEKLSSGEIGFKQYWRRIYYDLVNNKFDSWAYRWLFSCWQNQLLSIVPRYSLVRNIGFGEDATHTSIEPIGMDKNYNSDWQVDSINLKNHLVRDKKAEIIVSNIHYKCWVDYSVYLRLCMKLARKIKKILKISPRLY